MIWEDGVKIDSKEYDLSNLEFICETLPSGTMTDYAVSKNLSGRIYQATHNRIYQARNLSGNLLEFIRPPIITWLYFRH